MCVFFSKQRGLPLRNFVPLLTSSKDDLTLNLKLKLSQLRQALVDPNLKLSDKKLLPVAHIERDYFMHRVYWIKCRNN